MIVDDQRATRMGLSLIINRADDLQVTAEAVHGQDALDQLAALLEERRPLPDVVLMDVRMPVLNGIDATARISQLYPSIRVLVLTPYDQDESLGDLRVRQSLGHQVGHLALTWAEAAEASLRHALLG